MLRCYRCTELQEPCRGGFEAGCCQQDLMSFAQDTSVLTLCHHHTVPSTRCDIITLEEASTAGSVVLAGIMLKLGTYSFVRQGSLQALGLGVVSRVGKANGVPST